MKQAEPKAKPEAKTEAKPKAKPKAKSVRSAIVAVVDQPSGHLLTLSAQPYSFLISSTLARLTGVDSAPWPPICGDVPARDYQALVVVCVVQLR